MRFGLIGAGAIAQAYAEAFRRSKEAELVAVTDVRHDAAQALAETMKCAAFPSLTSLLAETDVDGVVICTPPVTHPALAAEALNADVAVLCEKPLSIDVASAREMARTAKSAGQLITMASKFRYCQDIQRAKSIVESGVIGEVVLFENCFTGFVDMSRRWNSNPAVSGGGVLVDNGTHSVDIMRYFLGPIVDLQVTEGIRIQPIAVEDTARMFVRSASGVMGSIDLSWSIHKPVPEFLSIYGSKGTIQVGWKESKCRVAGGDWQVFGKGYDKFESFTSQIDNFARAWRGQEPLMITIEDGIASVEVIEAAKLSLQQNRWQPVGQGSGVRGQESVDESRNQRDNNQLTFANS
jgi:predicted dehydrogenase